MAPNKGDSDPEVWCGMVQTVQKTFKFSLLQFPDKVFDVFPSRLWLEVDGSYCFVQCDTAIFMQYEEGFLRIFISVVFPSVRPCPSWFNDRCRGPDSAEFWRCRAVLGQGCSLPVFATTGTMVQTLQKLGVRAVLGQGFGRALLTAGKLRLLRSCSSSKVVDIPVVPLRLFLMVQFVRKTTGIPHLQCFDQVVDVPVVWVVQCAGDDASAAFPSFVAGP